MRSANPATQPLELVKRLAYRRWLGSLPLCSKPLRTRAERPRCSIHIHTFQIPHILSGSIGKTRRLLRSTSPSQIDRFVALLHEFIIVARKVQSFHRCPWNYCTRVDIPGTSNGDPQPGSKTAALVIIHRRLCARARQLPGAGCTHPRCIFASAVARDDRFRPGFERRRLIECDVELPANRYVSTVVPGPAVCRCPDIQKDLHYVMASPSQSPRAPDDVEAEVPTPENENENQPTEGEEAMMNRDDIPGYDFEVKEQDRWLPIANGELGLASLCVELTGSSPCTLPVVP